jgi:hypothetical protein
MSAAHELQGNLSAQEISALGPDLLAFIAAHQSYIELGPSFKLGSAFVSFDKNEGGWQAKVFNGARYTHVDPDMPHYPTLPDALQALRDRWMQ